MSKNEISHKGVIKSITPELTTVEILSTSACAECHAKGMCGMSESKVKEISVPTDPYSVHEVGDEVQVMLKKSMGLKAVWISYVIPLFILMILILSLSSVNLGAIAGVALYYLVIYLFRNRLANDFVFYIK